MKKVCNDCRYYLAVDVFKGLCKVNKNKIMPDDKVCPQFEIMSKCKYCTNYESLKEDTGTCKGKTYAYSEMIAITCDDFTMKN